MARQDRKWSWLKASTFALMFAPAIWIAFHVANGTFGRGVLGGLTYWSGLWATAILLLGLAVTPLATILQWRRAMSVRRMVGLAGLFYTIAHLLIYFALRYWEFAYIVNESMTRLSLIVALISTIGLIALGATSFDAAILRMGAERWNRLQKTVYVLTGLAILHYLLSPSVYSDQYFVSGIFLWLMGWRFLKRSTWQRDARALALLTVAAALLTVSLEIAWTWTYYDFDPAWVFANNFNLSFGLSAGWKVFILGCAVALTALTQQNLMVRSSKTDISPVRNRNAKSRV